MFTYKNYLHPYRRKHGFSSLSVLSVVWYRFFGPADQSSRRGLLCLRVCVCVFMCVCMCVCVFVCVYVILNVCYIACDQKHEWFCKPLMNMYKTSG